MLHVNSFKQVKNSFKNVNVHAVRDQRFETFAKSRSRFKIERNAQWRRLSKMFRCAKKSEQISDPTQNDRKIPYFWMSIAHLASSNDAAGNTVNKT